MKDFRLLLSFCLALCQVATQCFGYSTSISESEMTKLNSSIADFMVVPINVYTYTTQPKPSKTKIILLVAIAYLCPKYRSCKVWSIKNNSIYFISYF
jgi:hypothetical protein